MKRLIEGYVMMVLSFLTALFAYDGNLWGVLSVSAIAVTFCIFMMLVDVQLFRMIQRRFEESLPGDDDAKVD